MLMPRFSVRILLSLTFVAAILFFIGKAAIGGSPAAMAVLLTVLAAVILFVIFALFFLLGLLFLRMRGSRVAVESPFAHDKLPPQILAPDEVESR